MAKRRSCDGHFSRDTHQLHGFIKRLEPDWIFFYTPKKKEKLSLGHKPIEAPQDNRDHRFRFKTRSFDVKVQKHLRFFSVYVRGLAKKEKFWGV